MEMEIFAVVCATLMMIFLFLSYHFCIQRDKIKSENYMLEFKLKLAEQDAEYYKDKYDEYFKEYQKTSREYVDFLCSVIKS